MMGHKIKTVLMMGLMMGHNVLTVKIWIIIPKLSLLPLLIWNTAANSSKEITPSHIGNDITGS